ncbi:O-antigen ligase family protein [Planctomycetaceae bacterium SH139]
MRAAVTRNGQASVPRERHWSEESLTWSVYLLLFVAPLFLGGRHPLGGWIYVLACLPAAVALLARCLRSRNFQLSPIIWFLLGSWLLLPLLQTLPVSSGLTAAWGPGFEKMGFAGEHSEWVTRWGETFSLAPSVTRDAVPIVAVYVITFLLISARLQSLNDLHNVLRLIALSGAAIGLLALLQANFGNHRFLWLYDHPTRDPGNIPRGPFQNENHLCHLLAITLPLAFYLLARPLLESHLHSRAKPRHRRNHRGSTAQARRFDSSISADVHGFQTNSRGTNSPRDTWIFGSVVILCCAVVYATPSRGGAALVISGAGLFVSLLGWRALQRHLRIEHRWLTLGYWSSFAMLMAVGIGWAIRMMPQWSPWRWRIWSANVAMWQDFPLLGTGLGTHRYVYRAYLDGYFPQTFTHAESSVLQIFSEAGLVGGCLLGLAALFAVSRLRRATKSVSNPTESIGLAALTAAILVSLLHAIFDFPWHIPACGVPLMMLLAALYRWPELATETKLTLQTAQLKKQPARVIQLASLVSGKIPPLPISRLATISLVALLACLIGEAASSGLKSAKGGLAWDAYRRLNRELAANSPSSEETAPNNPTSDSMDALALSTDDSEELPRIAALIACLQADPQHPQATTRLAQHLVQRAAETESKTTRSALLRRAKSLAQRAAFVCPTQSEAALLIAEANFGLSSDLLAQDPLLTHALKLRPVDGRPLTRLAMIAMMRGEIEQADQYWESALELDPVHLPQTLKYLLIFRNPEEILEKYSPSLQPAEALLHQVAGKIRAEDLITILRYVTQAYLAAADAETRDHIAEQHYATAYRYATQTNQTDIILHVQNQRVNRNPQILANRLSYADYLLRAEQTQAAREQLAACQLLAPRNQQVRELSLQLDRLALRSANKGPEH